MATLQKIPLQPETTDQLVSVELGGAPYILRILWNERAGYFALSILTADEQPILTNIKMVKNYSLTGRFKKDLLPAGNLFFVQENGSIDRPGYSDLAVNFGLYYYDPDAEIPSHPAPAASAVAIGSVWDGGASIWDSGSTSWDQ
jgi:hypothetical protein